MPDTNSTINGAATGAAAGSAAGPYGAAIGGVVGLTSSLLAKKKKVNAPDLTGLINTANAGADKQISLAHGLTEALKPGEAQYKTDATANSAGLKTQVAGLGKDFMAEQEKLGEAAASNASNSLKQNIISAQPDIQRSLRESLAASGGLGRGASDVAAARVGQTAANQIGQGEAVIAQQKLEGLQNASQKVFGANVDAVTKATGLDADTLNTLLNSGRQDLIQEAQAIMSAERDRTSNILGVQQNANTQNLAAQTASAAGSNAFIQALLQSGGQAIGGYVGSKVATPAVK